jgi:hypothetical protein
MKPCMLVSILAALVLAGCGGDSDSSAPSTGGTSPVQAGASCGQPEGVAGEIIIVQRMSCAEAVRVAQAYFESGKPPRQWRTGSSKGWDCGGQIPGKRPVIAQCGSYSTAGSAQTTLARVFEVRPQ